MGAAIAAALMANTALQRLHLGHNELGAAAAGTVAAALPANRTLRFLDLQSNSIGVDAGTEISEALRENDSLRHLGLQNNGLGSGAAGAASRRRSSHPDTALCISSAILHGRVQNIHGSADQNDCHAYA